jgi:hypothetical protein
MWEEGKWCRVYGVLRTVCVVVCSHFGLLCCLVWCGSCSGG